MQIDRPIAIALILFTVLLLVFFLVMPEYNTFTNLQTQLGEKTAEYNAEVDYYAAIAKTYADLQSHSDDIKKIDDALPTNPDLGKVIYYLQKTSSDNGMIIKDLFLSKSSQAGAKNSIKNIVFSVDLLGDYQSLEKFMLALENSSRLFEITNISFGSSDQSQTGGSSDLTSAVLPGTQFQIQQIYNFSLQIKMNSY